MFKSLLRFSLYSLITMSVAQAGVFIEPLLGYASGSLETKVSGTFNETFDGDISGLVYGARLGAEINRWQIAFDYQMNKLKAKVDGNTDDLDLTEMGALVGYNLGFFRLYGGYIFSSEAKDSEGDAGTGMKLGATFYALTNLALSIEYKNVKFKKETNSDGDSSESNYNNIAFLVSFPFGT